MADPKKTSWIDPSKRAEYALDSVLEATSQDALAQEEVRSSVEKELQRAPMANIDSSREQSRVLFLTSDVSVLKEGSATQLHYLNISSVFNEVHIMVLCEYWQAKEGHERISKNVWVYTTSVRYWWQQPFAALSLAHNQLQFAEGFRPDIVVALDPIESGLSGMLIAQKYDREFQVHVLEDYFTPDFLALQKNNKWRLRVASYVLKRATSVRAATLGIRTSLAKKFRHLRDLSLLPRHFDIQTIINAASSEAKEDMFSQFSFSILYVGKLDQQSTLFRALDASRGVLQARTIGFVVVGTGPNKAEFQKRAEILGIKEQVLFLSDMSNLLSYLKSADVLMCPDTTESSDELIIKAAAAGLPLIMAKTPLRDDLFVDGESAFLCNPEDTIEFSQKLNKFLNTNTLRTQFAQNAQDTVKTRLHEDPNAFTQAYRDTIESVFDGEKTAIPQEKAS